ncbi:Ser/Thr protein phosphatase [Phialemonium atrogriseum]|uniref:Ser/Thr protein phosphatase n=1 Tax=Phialemonium atrogriseum TaxID=1093897 RepID=A0AAJ0BX52_9PEZI|nr:Ser/Thr protein phosphatase [Phialemonium atrogriseum]KAK1766100.1 Ser/Thr protein phosphatase [Phialemonium atrogriseum]
MTDQPGPGASNGTQQEQQSVVISLQIMSDLHLETPRFFPMYSDFHLKPGCAYLALLGDIGNAHDARLFGFLEKQLQQFRVVFYIIGNHEPYQDQDSVDSQSYTHQDTVAKMEDFEEAIAQRRKVEIREVGTPSIGQFVFLNRNRFDISDTITILGCTLFSNVTESQRSTVSLFVSDFSNILGWTVDSHNAAHKVDLEWLNAQVTTITRDEPHRSIVILTHYSPTSASEANDPEHLEDSGGVQSAFVTDLAREVCWTSPSVRLWAFGHTHYNCDFVDAVTGKRVVANQRGYGREDAFDFDPDKVVTPSTQPFDRVSAINPRNPTQL